MVVGIRKLPIGIQSFESLRSGGYLYVDKTRCVWDLVQTGRTYFLSRPRRFGKSLLVSTLEAYFRGRRDLFDGLAIQALEDARGEDAWQEYPVVVFSLSSGDYHLANGLPDTLNSAMQNCAEEYGLAGRYEVRGETLSVRFRNLLRQLHAKTGRQVVVLVDEYDKPLLETMIVDPEQEERNRWLYKGFFSALKDEDAHVRFAFFTGVTKFSKVSIFSDLNQLHDISLSEEAAGICGITQDELIESFGPEVEDLAEALGVSREDCIGQLARMYDGYHFCPNAVGVYNPFSLLNALRDRRLASYWFETGTPTFLIRRLRASSFTPEALTDGVEVGETGLTDYRTDNPNPIPLFYQTGYLTIHGYDPEFRIYELGFPNNEVKYGFLNSLVPYVLGEEDAEQAVSLRSMVRDLRRGDVDSFMGRLRALFAAVPYPEGGAPVYEREWRNQVFLVFALLGQNVQSEVHSAKGRADCVVQTARYVYVFEFKLDQPAEVALAQIDERGYARPYGADPRKICKVGVSFSTADRNIASWQVAS